MSDTTQENDHSNNSSSTFSEDTTQISTRSHSQEINTIKIVINDDNGHNHEKSEIKPPSPSAGENVDDQTTLLPFKQLLIVFMGLSLAIFLSSLDQTIVSTALPKIASDFHALSDISWVGTAYLLTSTAFQPLYGKFSDIFGRKSSFLFAISTFVVGSVLCGASVDMPMLIVSRAIAGIGGGGIMSLVMIIISDIVPLRERGKYQGIIGGTFTISSVVGPLIGGAFTDHISWRWAFYINLPTAALTIIIIITMLHLPHVYGSLKEKIKRIDFIGTIFLVASIVIILLPLNWGGNTYSWDSPIVISLFCVGAVLVCVFIFIEFRIAIEPVIPQHLFKLRNPVLVYITSFFIGMAFYGFIYYLPLYFQAVRGYSATEAGLQLIPLVLGLVLFSTVSGFATTVTGSYRPWIIFGYGLTTVASGLLSTLNENSNRGEEIGYLLIAGAGLGCSMQTVLLAAQSSVEHKDIAVVTSLSSFFRTIGGVFGVAISGAIFNNKLSSYLIDTLPSNIPLELVKNSVEYIHTLPPDTQTSIIHAYVHALSYVFFVAIPMAGVATITSLFIKHIPLRKTLGPIIAE
ncbi:12488_t:CDS:1 [Ambispora leptoticha]|uniref:12488_t:CDS:1 n=1 Tax=Ambispora leptoticha TaxID=144679 RepID=A0A9N9C6V4_9GLOM|nr:12488_t:CDS:1 [Ambispora leptoticha]